MKKLIFVISFIVLFSFLFGVTVSEAKAVTLAELEAQIIRIQAQITELQSLLAESSLSQEPGEETSIPDATAPETTEITEAFAPGRLLIRFKDRASEAAQEDYIKKFGYETEKEIKPLNIKVVSVPKGREKALAQILSINTDVVWVEPDYVVEAVSVPNDLYFDRQWGMTMIQAPAAWDVTTGSSNIDIAILDTGVDQDHPDLASKIVSNINFTSSPTVDDIEGHGTHVAGIAAAVTNNSIGVAGLGHRSSIMNVKVLGDGGAGTYSGLISGIIWAVDNGAEVINMSLGGSGYSLALEDAVNYAWSKGVVVVAAAGNSGITTPLYPAAYAKCIAVAATNGYDDLASFSNYGSWVDVAAPGTAIYATYKGGVYGYKGGTSMAAPHVAGLAGLVFTTVSDTNGNGFLNDEVRSQIETSCDDIGVSGIGSGRINAFSAVSSTGVVRHTLSVSKISTGSGTVTSSPSGIYCGNNCSALYSHNTSVTLTAIPANDSTFTGWSGACTGAGTCTVSMSGDKAVTAALDVINDIDIIDCSAEYGQEYWCSDYEGWQIECQGEGDVKDLPEGTLCKDELGEQYDKCVTCVHQETFSLSVESTPLTNIPITGEPTDYTGRTNYIREDISAGTNISLTASNYGDYLFMGWDGCDAASGPGATAGPSPICELTMDSDHTVTANYVLYHTLSVSKISTGSGTVTSSPSGIYCGNNCSALYSHNTSVTLTAIPANDSTFTGWSGACTGAGTCTVLMGSDKAVTASFDSSEPVPECTTYNGYTYCRGFKSTDPQGSSCNAACSERGYSCPRGDNMFRSVSQIAEVAVALDLLAPGENYSSYSASYYYSPLVYKTSWTTTKKIYYSPEWKQICFHAPGSGSAYESIKICRCEGTSTTHTLSISKTGTGSGTVTSNPAGINCGFTCSASYNHNTSVTLTATPDPGSDSTFTGWSGACTGAGTCTVLMGSDKAVTASFDTTEVTHTLTVNSSPVTGIPIDSTTGHSGTTNYSKTDIETGASVALTAPATYGIDTVSYSYTFSDWTGCDSATSTICNLTMNSNRTVTANYEASTHTLSISKTGTGSGTVTSNPAGINCGFTCSASYNHNTSVTLTATPDPGSDSTFTGWSGACTGAGTCTVLMGSDKAVTASFDSSEPVPECTTYNGYTYCRGFKSTDPQGSSCNAACSERGYICLVGDNMFRSVSQIAEVAVALDLLAPGEEYASQSSKYYYSPLVYKTSWTTTKKIYYSPEWKQICFHAPGSGSAYESIKICRCQEKASRELDYMGSQLASLSNALSKLSELVGGLLGR